MRSKAIQRGAFRTATEMREIGVDAEAVASTAKALNDAARRRGFWLSADERLGEADVADLLGLTAGSLANKRREGTAPRAYELGGGRHRVTYRLIDVARWIEAHRVR